MDQKRSCPECHLVFEAPLPERGVLACPLCNTMFSVIVPSAPPAAPTSAPAASGRQVLRGVLAIGALLFLVGSLVYAYRLINDIDHKSTSPRTSAPERAESAELTTRPAVIPEVESPPVIIPQTIIPEAKPRFRAPPLQPVTIPPPIVPVAKPRMPPPPMQAPAPVDEPSRPLTLPERINRAIDHGLAYLQKHHTKHHHYQKYLGLLGLTLLECDIPASDPCMQEMAAWIRAQERELTQTYELTLAILFLDRLGEARDQVLIRRFGQRLLDGQLEGGTWSYSCLSNAKRDGRKTAPQMPQIINWSNRFPAGKQNDLFRRLHYRGDNSNTQFALLGLWVAQRHGVSARSALLATERYFRDTQYPDGSWSYQPFAPSWRDSNTCAGLMSLAMRHGVIARQGGDIRPGQRVHIADGAVFHGLTYLAQSLDHVSIVGDRIVGMETRDPLYFLWSLERMAVIYGLHKIGDREWYPWAAQLLVDMQRPDGRWHSGMGEPVGTCFALLILKRSNLAKDLQLAVQEAPPRRVPDLSGPTILQGRDALLRATGKLPGPASMPGTAIRPASSTPLGPSIIQMPNNK